MSKFNRGPISTPATRATSPLTTVAAPTLHGTPTPDATTHEGGAGYQRGARTELFLTCTTSFITESSFYETGDERTARVVALTHEVAREDDGPGWLLDFVTWLRGPEGNMRTAAIVVAAETVRAYRTAAIALGDTAPELIRVSHGAAGSTTGAPGTLRRIISAALQRADEPGEMVSYWATRYGKPLPNSIKRGIADAVTRLYTEYSTLKWDTSKAAVRFGDVVALTHPRPPADKAVLFRHLIERRHPDWKDGGGQRLGDRDLSVALPMTRARARLEGLDVAARRRLLTEKPFAFREMLRHAGATWEYISGWLSDGKGMDAAAWEAVIPQMGYMALLRNLRNFDEAGVSDEVAARVAVKLEDPEEVARSRQFPFRFLSAYEAAPSDRWKLTLGQALGYATQNLPELNGSTLIMVDTSGSMRSSVSGKSTRTCVEVAALFGIALTYRNAGEVGLYGFANHPFRHGVTVGGSVLAEVQKFAARIGEAGHGTEIERSTLAAYGAGYDRVIILSDMQSFDVSSYAGDLLDRIPSHVPIYAFDVSSYATGIIPTGGAARFQLGGLSDATFRMIPQMEAGRAGFWPWKRDLG